MAATIQMVSKLRRMGDSWLALPIRKAHAGQGPPRLQLDDQQKTSRINAPRGVSPTWRGGTGVAISPHRRRPAVAKNERVPSSLRPSKRQAAGSLCHAANHHDRATTLFAGALLRDRRVCLHGESGNCGQLDFRDVSACAVESYNTIFIRVAAARETACSIA